MLHRLSLYSRYNRTLSHFALSVAVYSTPSPPALHRFPMPPLPIARQIALDFFPSLYDLLAALSPVEPRRLRIQTFLFEHVHDILEFCISVLVCSFLRREREEQGLARVERDLNVRK